MTKKRLPRSGEQREVRKPLRQRLRTDFSHLEKVYPNKCFRLFNNEMGNIQKALLDGWEPVEGASYQSVWRSDANKPTQQGDYVRIPVGLGRTENSMEAVLLMIDKDRFIELQEPLYEHRRDVKASLKRGKAQSDERIATYAPNLPSGGVGFEQKSD